MNAHNGHQSQVSPGSFTSMTQAISGFCSHAKPELSGLNQL